MNELRARTKRFAVKVFDLIDEIPQSPKGTGRPDPAREGRIVGSSELPSRAAFTLES